MNTQPPPAPQPDIKQLLAAWAGITVERFQQEIDKKIYSRLGQRTTKRGVQSSRLGGNYRFGGASQRTGNLRKMWQENVQADPASAIDRIQIAFLMYGRFVDMGVGKGVDHVYAKYARNRRNGENLGRKPKRWYSRRKGYETHRLRELLVQYNINLPLDLVENALTQNINLTV